jgi:VWFA-related protein
MHVVLRRGLSWTALVAMALVLEASARAGDEPVSLDVVVTDAKERPLRDLRPADLELTDSGETWAIDAVSNPPERARVFGIFLDEFHVAAGEATDRARAALLRFLDTQLRDGDSVAVVKPLDPLHAITFVQDRAVVRQVIAGFEGHSGDYTPRTEFERNFLTRDPTTAEPARAQVASAALQALSRKLGDQQEGRKALIFVSEGFRPAQPRAIVYAANRNRVSIYPVDPSAAPGDDDAMLDAFAEQTGGMASVNAADLTPVLAKAASDLDSHIIISFKRSGDEDGRYHAVQVRVKRKGALARVRSGYWAPDAALAAAAAKAAAPRTTLPFRPSHSSPFIQPWIGMTKGDDGLTRVTVTWEPGDDPPRNQRVGMITLKAMNRDGELLFEHRIGPGDTDRAAFDAAPGLIAIEMAIETSSGTPLDTDYRAVTVPNLDVSKPTFATPQMLRTSTARQFDDVSRDPEAIASASRTFSRRERLLVRVPAYAAGDTPPVVTARLLNRRGAVMRDLSAVAAPLPPGIVQFDLPLASLAPEEYRIELTAANAAGPKDEVKEILTFRVTN